MSDDVESAAQRIADTGRLDVVARLRDALAGEATAAGITLTSEELDRLAPEALVHAGGALWRRALAGAAVGELGLGLGEAVDHPAVVRAHDLVGAPPFPGAADEPLVAAEAPGVEAEAPAVAAEAPAVDSAEAPVAPAATPDAVRVSAVHLGGIEALRPGEGDLELRISPAGLDVLKRSSGAPIGRLTWGEIQTVDLPRGRRGLRPGRRPYELHVSTGSARASFQLPGVTTEQLRDHLEPVLARARAGAP